MNTIALNTVTDSILTTIGRVWKEKIEPVIKNTFDPWEREKRELLKDVSDPDKSILGILLDNANNARANCSTMDYQGATSMQSAFGKTLPALTKTIYQHLTIKDIIGFQPMKGPVSLVYTLQYKDKVTNEEGRELSLNILSSPVQAGSHKLQTAWTIEFMHDLLSLHTSLQSRHVLNVIGVAIAEEINYFWLNTLFTTFSGSERGRVTGLDAEVLVNKIYEACNNIARKSRRGAGNVVVMDGDMFLLIKSKLKLDKKAKEESTVSLKYVGSEGTIDFYTYVATDANANKNKILVGYKGKSGEVDVAVIFAPYVLINPQGPSVDSPSFVPHIPLMTRYGVHIVENAADYYQVLEVEMV